MRDLIDLLDKILSESQLDEEVTLSAGEITKYPKRFDAFIDHIRSGGLFFVSGTNEEITVDPAEADRIEALHQQKMFNGVQKVTDINGNVWPISKFKKTAEFGGAAVKPGEEGDLSKISKDAAKLKPAEIGITGKDIAAKDLLKSIISNTVLNSTEWGRAVIKMANDIANGQDAVIPEALTAQTAIVKAIVDNAGEYLGVLALVSGQSQWYGGASKRQDFVKWLGSDLGNLTVNFPAGQTNPLADSYATVSNAATGHTLNISSKGTGGGAAPALSKMKVPDSLRKNKKYKTVIELIELSTTSPAATVGFEAMNLLYNADSASVPKEYKNLLPWSDTVIAAARKSFRDGSPMPAKYQKIVGSVKSTAADGGRLMYAVKRDVAKMVNTGAVPEFAAVLLQILDLNFIQQYATFEGKKTGTISFATQWPAKIDGEVSMENKSSAPDPSSGGFSFKLHPTGTPIKVDPETGDVQDDESSTGDGQDDDDQPKTTTRDLDAVARRTSDVTASGRMSGAAGDEKSLGRKRRR